MEENKEEYKLLSDYEEEHEEENEVDEVPPKEVVDIKSETNKKIKEISFSLNTGQSGEVSYTTKKINGFLEALYIDTDDAVGIKVNICDSCEMCLFDFVNFTGAHYLPIRISALSDSGEAYRDSPEKIALNDSITFYAKGNFNTNVKIIVRYC